ncbi:MAG TPA: methylated-DNA--[protein]-cysteine S-methyltransferase [Thermoanaerobaculia bacterium]|jgi:methylated-DNA-[protein]-cysteine S-methyltransferase|nr:methylated-DNA--[protein]-cysteine S-methyltransferase [Thermoanaerobaculia bacterium]
MNYTATFDSPCGPLICVVDEDGAVVRIAFGHGRDAQKIADLKAETEVIEDASHTAEVRRQLEEYFAGRRQEFDLPLAPRGTPFELAVWEELRRIPFGETRSYADVARALGKPAATRAVGRANGANPIPIVVPCHRVIGSDGSLTGFGGGLAAKARLLEIEGRSLPFSV